MMIKTSSVMALAALASKASALFYINNWCTVDVNVVSSHNAECDIGSDGICIDQGGIPWTLGPGNGTSFMAMDYVQDGIGTSFKISKSDVAEGVLQFEINYVADPTYGGIYWDLSDLDGSGAGLVGTPFSDQNVKVSPTGNGAGSGTCVQIKCKANETCYDSYQNPDDPNTMTCPLDTGDMWLDLCQPDDQFNTKKRSAIDEGLSHKVSRHLAAHRHHHGRSALNHMS